MARLETGSAGPIRTRRIPVTADAGPLHVACAGNDAYLPHTAAMLHSVLAHRGRLEVNAHYMHGADADPEGLELLSQMVNANGGTLTRHEIPPAAVDDLPTMPPFSLEMWFRILLPELLPEVARVLYLDADTIAADDLTDLWNTGLGTSYLAAVTNVFQHNHLHRPASLGLAGPEVYFNSGVLLMNLARMRQDSCSRALREYALAHRDSLEWPDQDALNVVLGPARVPLHPRWNCMNSVLDFPSSQEVFGPEAVAEARRRPAIRHYEGPAGNKPWHYMSFRPSPELYWSHRSQTPWPEHKLEGATPGNRVRRFARGLRRR